jgi:hypothetical protein
VTIQEIHIIRKYLFLEIDGESSSRSGSNILFKSSTAGGATFSQTLSLGNNGNENTKSSLIIIEIMSILCYCVLISNT